METDLLIANRLNERLSVEKSLHDINQHWRPKSKACGVSSYDISIGQPN